MHSWLHGVCSKALTLESKRDALQFKLQSLESKRDARQFKPQTLESRRDAAHSPLLKRRVDPRSCGILPR